MSLRCPHCQLLLDGIPINWRRVNPRPWTAGRFRLGDHEWRIDRPSRIYALSRDGEHLSDHRTLAKAQAEAVAVYGECAS